MASLRLEKMLAASWPLLFFLYKASMQRFLHFRTNMGFNLKTGLYTKSLNERLEFLHTELVRSIAEHKLPILHLLLASQYCVLRGL